MTYDIKVLILYNSLFIGCYEHTYCNMQFGFESFEHFDVLYYDFIISATNPKSHRPCFFPFVFFFFSFLFFFLFICKKSYYKLESYELKMMEIWILSKSYGFPIPFTDGGATIITWYEHRHVDIIKVYK